FAEAASYIETLAADVSAVATKEKASASLELHLRRLAFGRIGQLEVLLRLESERAGEDVGRKSLERRVVVAHVPVVEPAREGDLVLGRGEVLREILELLHGLKLRVVLGDREHRTQRAREHVLGLGSL